MTSKLYYLRRDEGHNDIAQNREGV
jgi:hypothetical protein